jgi:dTDP-4-dehydrorhamnose reductase
MRIGVLGGRGRLGSQLIEMGCEHIDVDVTQKFHLPPDIDIVINCAAYTSVDGAEDREEYAKVLAVNYFSLGRIYAMCQLANVHLIHLSTDYVFGGNRGPYSEVSVLEESDVPMSAYGISKLGAEGYLLQQPDTTVVRTTGLYGGVSTKNDFLKHTVSILEQGKLFPVTDQLIGNQTYIPHLAQALLVLSSIDDKPGLLHIASSDVCSRYVFACMIADMWELDQSLLIPVSNNRVPGWKAQRPTKGGLITAKADRMGIPIFSILEGLEESHENWNCNSTV